jgi:AcrR family transcriptional regulator
LTILVFLSILLVYTNGKGATIKDMLAEKPYNRKQQIAIAAMEILSEEGMQNLAMMKIANRIGVTDAAIYRHFTSKDEMLIFMIDMIEKAMFTRIVTLIENIEDPLLKLEKVLRFQLEFCEDNKGIPRIIFTEFLQYQNKKVKKKIAKILNNYMTFIQKMLKAAVSNGQIKKDINLDSAATIFLGMIQSNVILWTLADYSYPLKSKINSLWEEYSKIIK